MTIVPETMAAAVLTGHGGFDKLEYRTDVPVPKPRINEVLIRVAAAGVNNTDINTRTGWYSKQVTTGSNAGGATGFEAVGEDDASWAGQALQFPRIQGVDVCGYIVSAGDKANASRIGERVIVRSLLRSYVKHRPFECWTFGSECDGGFAQYTIAPSSEVFAVRCSLSDAELGAIPAAYSTAENMLDRANVGAGEKVLITGASGGVGSAAVQLARRRGATVIAVASRTKAEAIRSLGANHLVDRDADLLATLGSEAVDVVIDVVGAENWNIFFQVLRRGGRCAVAGAIAGPLAQIDIREIYLKDLSILGCTFYEDRVFSNLISYIEDDEIRPLIAKTYPLSDIVQAQKDFLDKRFVGKLVLIPPMD